MTKTYKLLKDTPEFKAGELFKEHQTLKDCYYSLGKFLYHYSRKTVENNPEWFEEVKEKDWEILSVKRDNDIFIRNGNMFEAPNRHSWRDDIILSQSNNVEIISVKRMSDGLIAEVKKPIGCVLNNDTFIVEKIDISTGEPYIIAVGYLLPLRNAKTVIERAPLFKTFDGVEIFDENKVVYSVCTKSSWETRTSTYQRYGGMRNGTAFTESNPWKHFSTEELRNEYIIMNQPCLSIKDVLDSWVPYPYKFQFKINITALVKQKLKL